LNIPLLTHLYRSRFYVSTEIYNANNFEVDFILTETIPSTYHLLVRSIQLTCENKNTQPDIDVNCKAYDKADFRYDHYHNGSLHFPIYTLLPHAAVKIQFACKKLLLHREDYPTDSSRGFEVSPATIEYGKSSFSLGYKETIKATSNVVTSAYPDFTMPFNVMTLVNLLIRYINSPFNVTCQSSAISAFLLGSILNVITKKLFKKR